MTAPLEFAAGLAVGVRPASDDSGDGVADSGFVFLDFDLLLNSPHFRDLGFVGTSSWGSVGSTNGAAVSGVPTESNLGKG